MKKKILVFTKKPFVRNVIIISTGTIAAQLVYMGFSPLITRLYGPEKYGLLSVFTSIVAIVAPISALTYPIAIVLPKNNANAKKIMLLSFYIACLMAFFSMIFLFWAKNEIVSLFSIHEMSPYIYLVPLVIIGSGLLQIIENWLIRTKQFSITAKVSFIQAFTIQGSIVLIGFYYPSVFVLIVATTIGIFFKALLMFMFNQNKLRVRDFRKSNQTEILTIFETAKTHKDFLTFRAPEVFVNSISQSLPILLLTTFFGPASVGFYSIGRTVLSIPSQLIGKAVGDVFYPRISEAAQNHEKLSPLIYKATIALGFIGVIPFLLVILFGPNLFSFVFGNEWETAGEYARWMSIWLYFMFLNQPSIKALPVLSAQAFHLKYSIFMLIVRLIALSIGYFVFSSDLIAIIIFAISGALLNIGLILITIKLSKNFDIKSQKTV